MPTIRVKITRDKSNRIITLDLEEYLRGVVPSEMPSTWPIEALKAQAVAARTYAMSKLNSSRSYDVDDTTAYQAYRSDRTRESTDKAVKETAGQVLKYGGKLISAVYCASNGGKTISAKQKWGHEHAYLPAQSDPYDAASGQKKNGHGVGMSQHGARQAALKGLTYKQILSFYYPNTQIVSSGKTSTFKVETLKVTATSLNIRKGAGTGYEAISQVPKGTLMLGGERSDGWRHVIGFVGANKTVDGWACEKYLEVI